MTGKRSLDALNVSEAFVRDQATREQLQLPSARDAAWHAANAALYVAGYAEGYAARDYQQKLMAKMIIAGIESGDVK